MANEFHDAFYARMSPTYRSNAQKSWFKVSPPNLLPVPMNTLKKETFILYEDESRTSFPDRDMSAHDFEDQLELVRVRLIANFP